MRGVDNKRSLVCKGSLNKLMLVHKEEESQSVLKLCMHIIQMIPMAYSKLFSTKNPQISDKGLFAKLNFCISAYAGGGAYFKVWHFPLRLTLKNDMIF